MSLGAPGAPGAHHALFADAPLGNNPHRGNRSTGSQKAPSPWVEPQDWGENSPKVSMTVYVLRMPSIPLGATGRALNGKTQGIGDHQAHVQWVAFNHQGQKAPKLTAPAAALCAPSIPLSATGRVLNAKTQVISDHQAHIQWVVFNHRGQKAPKLAVPTTALCTPGKPLGATGHILNTKTRGISDHQTHLQRVAFIHRGQKAPKPAAPALVLRTPSRQLGIHSHIVDVKTQWTGGHQTLFRRVCLSHRGRKPHTHNLVFTHAASRLLPSDWPQLQRHYMYWERNRRGAKPASSSSTFISTWSTRTCDEMQIWNTRPHDQPKSSGSCLGHATEMPEARPASGSPMQCHERGSHTLGSDSPMGRGFAPLAYTIVPSVPAKHVNPMVAHAQRKNKGVVPSKHVNPVDVPAKHINTMVTHAQREKKGAVHVQHVNTQTVCAEHTNTGAMCAQRIKTRDLSARQVKIRVVLPMHYKTGTATSLSRSWNTQHDNDDSPWLSVLDCLRVLASTQYLSKQGENQSPIAYHSYWCRQDSGLPTIGEPHSLRKGCYSRPSTHLSPSMHALSSDDHPAHSSILGSRKVGRCGGGPLTLSLPIPHVWPSGDPPKPYGTWGSGRGGGNRGPSMRPKRQLRAEPSGPPSALSSTRGSGKRIGGRGGIGRGFPHPDTATRTLKTGACATAPHSQHKIAAILSYFIFLHQLPYWSNVHTSTIHPSTEGKMKSFLMGQTLPRCESSPSPVHQSLST